MAYLSAALGLGWLAGGMAGGSGTRTGRSGRTGDLTSGVALSCGGGPRNA